MQKKSENDIVQDILARVAEAAAKQPDKPLSDDVLKKIEQDVRHQWGGDRPYIGIRSGEGHSERNSRIYRQYLQGERLEFLARRHSISYSQTKRIIQTQRELSVPMSRPQQP